MCFLFAVKTPEASIERYQKVLNLVRAGKSKSEAYDLCGVDRNTISNQAPIAELQVVLPNQYNTLRSNFAPGSNLKAFAKLCETFCVAEPQATRIVELKQRNILLDIYKK